MWPGNPHADPGMTHTLPTSASWVKAAQSAPRYMQRPYQMCAVVEITQGRRGGKGCIVGLGLEERNNCLKITRNCWRVDLVVRSEKLDNVRIRWCAGRQPKPHCGLAAAVHALSITAGVDADVCGTWP